jgi:hypothetical protein
MIAMRLMLVGLDENFARSHLCRMVGDVQVVASGVFAIVNHLASDTVQRTVVEVKSFFGQAIFQAIESVMAQVVIDEQSIRGVAIFNCAVRQAGQKLIGAIQLSGRVRTEYYFALFVQIVRIKHFDLAVTKLFALQYLNPLEKIQRLVELIVVLGAEFGRLGIGAILVGIRWGKRALATCV